MTLLSRQEIEDALRRLGELAAAEGQHLEVLLVGGAAMVLGYDARPSTHDVDGVFGEPPIAATTRKWIQVVAEERGWQADWFNDSAKGYLVGMTRGRKLMSVAGLDVWQPRAEQLLAMKLMAWRDDVDVDDATRLLKEVSANRDKLETWELVVAFVLPGRELKCHLAFEELWKDTRGFSA